MLLLQSIVSVTGSGRFKNGKPRNRQEGNGLQKCTTTGSMPVVLPGPEIVADLKGVQVVVLVQVDS
jgi:hypothetical protein